jgi:hypothetical protein
MMFNCNDHDLRCRPLPGWQGIIYINNVFDYPDPILRRSVGKELMRVSLCIAIVMLAIASSNVMARGLVVEPQGMVYFRLSFDSAAGKKQTSPSFGFRMDHVSYAMGRTVDFRQLMQQTPILDFRMGNEGVKAIYISGTDYLRRYRVQHADESSDDAATQEKNDAGTGKTEKQPPLGEKVGSDIKGLATTVWDTVPVGILIGVGFGLALAAGAGG